MGKKVGLEHYGGENRNIVSILRPVICLYLGDLNKWEKRAEEKHRKPTSFGGCWVLEKLEGDVFSHGVWKGGEPHQRQRPLLEKMKM